MSDSLLNGHLAKATPEETVAVEERVAAAIRQRGPLLACRDLLAKSDALIRGPELGNGRQITALRAAVYAGLIADWAAERHQAFGYDKPFAVVALGGTGRGEVAPYSDTDFAFLFDDVIEGNSFLLRLQEELLHTDGFRDRCGFACEVLPFNLDDVLRLEDKQLNAFLDMRPVYDLSGLTGVFRERIRATFDPFEHFLHVRSFWKERLETAATEWDRVDRFDIKNDGLRVFLAGIWTLAGRGFLHSHEVYRALDDPRDLAAYDFLLRVRCFVHLRRAVPKRRPPRGDHPEDVMSFDDFRSFGELLGPDAEERTRFEFADEVRARLISARRRVARFTQGVIQRELKEGRPAGRGSPIVYGVGGLSHQVSGALGTARERSRAALSLLLASQRYGVPIDPSELGATFDEIGDWLTPVPELSALFYEPRGSLAESFAFLSQFDGAEDRLFPGYAHFEASFDTRVVVEGKRLRGAIERQKMRILEGYVQRGRELLARAISSERATDALDCVSIEVEAALLDSDHLAAVKLALKTKRLPLTEVDQRMREDTTRPLHERFSSGTSGIPLERYYGVYRTECGFTPETMRTTEFLIRHWRVLRERADADLNDQRQVGEFAALCENEDLLRCLFVFTCADRAEWQSEQEDPTPWFNMRELYVKAMRHYKPGLDPKRSMETAGFTPEQLGVLKDFGPDFYAGVYRRYANRFATHLLHLAEYPSTQEAKVSILRDGLSVILGVAARDARGLAACITGALWRQEVRLRQAHLFSAAHHGLALDFFHVEPGENPVGPRVVAAVEHAIRQRLFINERDEARIPHLEGEASLQEWRPGQYGLRFETDRDADGAVYMLTYKVFRYLEGNIFGLAAHLLRGRVYVSVYLSLPPHLTLEGARRIVAERF